MQAQDMGVIALVSSFTKRPACGMSGRFVSVPPREESTRHAIIMASRIVNPHDRPCAIHLVDDAGLLGSP